MEKIPAFVALDLETTGLDFEKDEIIEVALVRFEKGEPKENLDFLVKPSSWLTFSPCRHMAETEQTLLSLPYTLISPWGAHPHVLT